MTACARIMLLCERHRSLLGVQEYAVENKPTSIDSCKCHAEYIRMAQQGDPDAFAALFNTHKGQVYSICLRMTRNTAEAEDLTQDVFLQVFRKLASFHGDSTFSTWLYRVAVNTVLMHLHKKRLRQVSLDEPINRAAIPQKRVHAKVDDRLSRSVDRIDLARAMNELPTRCRTIFVLHEVQGHEHYEIASLLHCAVGTSKSQLLQGENENAEVVETKSSRAPENHRGANR